MKAHLIKRILFVPLLIFIVWDVSFAQQRVPPLTLQEIKAEIEQLSTAEQKLRKYIEAAPRNLRNQPESLMVIANEIASLEGISQNEKDAFSYYILADAWRTMNMDSTIFYAEKAANLLEELGEHESYLSVENLRGLQYNRKREFIEAERTFLKALNYFQENNGADIEYPVHFIYGNLGNLYSRVGAHDLAIQMFEQFLEIEDNPVDRCNILNRLSNSMAELNNLERARDLLSPCLELENLPPPIKATIRSNLSQYYEELGEQGISLSLMQEAARISYTNSIPNLGIAHLIRVGRKYLEANRIEEADSVKSLIVLYPQQRVIPNTEITNELFFAELALAKNDYKEALKYTNKAIELANRYNLENELRHVYSLQSEAYEALGDLSKAIELQKKQNEVDRERSDQETAREIAMMNVRFQLQSTQSDLDKVNTKLRVAQVRNLAIIVLILLIGFYVIYKYRVYYLLKEEKTRTRIARDLHDDLSGTLSSISFFSEAAQRVQNNFAQSSRFMKMIDESAAEAKEKINDIIWAIDPIKDDWSVFLKKCKRHAADAFDSKEIEYELEIDDDFKYPVRVEVRQNMWLIFKETISNLVRHSDASRAYVKLVSKGRNITFEVKDNGTGFDTEKTFEGNGLKNIVERTHAINGECKVESNPEEGTHWQFRFPQL